MFMNAETVFKHKRHITAMTVDREHIIKQTKKKKLSASDLQD